jgi:hypothetical protein
VHKFASLIIASAVAITPAQAQTASELRISGTVEKLDGTIAALSLSRDSRPARSEWQARDWRRMVSGK